MPGVNPISAQKFLYPSNLEFEFDEVDFLFSYRKWMFINDNPNKSIQEPTVQNPKVRVDAVGESIIKTTETNIGTTTFFGP